MVKKVKNKNFKKLTLRGGISLITLVITIVVIIILAMAVILSLNNNNLISNANKATVKNDISEAQSAYSIYVGDLIIKELDNVQGTGTIGKNNSNFKTVTEAGIKEKRNITLKDIGINSNNVEEVFIVKNQIVGIKWKNKYYDVNGVIITEQGYNELGGYKGLTITANTENVTYTDKDGNEKALTEPVENGDIVIYGDYEYRYNMVFTFDGWITIEEAETNMNQMVNFDDGWGVRVVDDTKSKYSEICGTILEKDVTNLFLTFAACSYIVESPEIPNTVTNMMGTFIGSSLIKAPDIPDSVTNMMVTFTDCQYLTDIIEINANPIIYEYCFQNTTKSIGITGKCPLSKLESLADTANNGNVIVIPKNEFEDGYTHIYGDYKYTYIEASGGWNVEVIDKTKTEYDQITNFILGIPVVSLNNTFAGCTSLSNFTSSGSNKLNVPFTVTSMVGTFTGCINLITSIFIDSEIKNFDNCFSMTNKIINIYGDYEENLNLIAKTAENDNVYVNSPQ